MRITLLLLSLFCFKYSVAQQTEHVDFLTCKAELAIYPEKQNVIGVINYTFKIKEDVDSIFIDAKNISFNKVSLNKRKATYKVSNKKLWLFKNFKKGKEYSVSFNYVAHPKKAMYFIDWENQDHSEANPQIWTQGQGKDNSNWIPSFDDMNEKVEFDLAISFNKNYEVITNGKLISKQVRNDSVYTWNYDMQQPMSSYLLAIAIGNYKKQTDVSNSGIPLTMYYYPKDALKYESTYRYSKEMFDFLEEEIGVQYPWQNYKQVPVKDFLYAGMENTSATIFSDAFVVDSIAFIDKNYVNVNAHELAHQWFGDLVTETHGTHHWLHEGFATYYALLAEKEVFGNTYYYRRLGEYLTEIKHAQKNDTIPLMNPKASSLTFYKKGALVLHNLRERIGDSVFKLSVKQYLEKHRFKNVETNDFLSIVEKESGQKLVEFKEAWLTSGKLSFLDISNLERKINSKIFDVKNFDIDNNEETEKIKPIYYDSLTNKQLFDVKNKFKSYDIKKRQAIANQLADIPQNFKIEYESLLQDKSYQTIEIALFNLWINFPKSRKQYLDKTMNVSGFNDKNVRTLWLALALNTKGFEKNAYQGFYNELVSYTKPVYHFEVRRNAFEYLNELQLINSEVLLNLTQASKHHNWRFRSYSKKLLKHLRNKN